MKSYLKNIDGDWFKHRFTRTILFVLMAFIVILARLFYLQVIGGEAYRKLSENNSIRLKMIDPQRGLLFDRTGELLVDNRPSFNLTIVLKNAKPIKQTLEKLAFYLNIPVKELNKTIGKHKKQPSFKPILLKRNINRDQLALVMGNRFDLPGVNIDVKPRRQYINRFGGAHLIGYLSEISSAELNSGRYPDYRSGDLIGKSGVEKIFDSYLRGKRGGKQIEVDASGRMVKVLKQVDATPGYNIVLSIDHRLQQKAESLLNQRAGSIVAIDPQTGDVLALASSPTFDQNAFITGISHKDWNLIVSNPFRPMENKATQAVYPPASTYKIVTAIAGLEEGVINTDTALFCPGFYKMGNRTFRCWKRSGHGWVKIEKALIESCDVYFYQVGERLGVDRLAKYAKRFGLGWSTGIDLDAEANGLIPTAAWKKKRFGVSWQGGETLSVAIGQGFNLTTPIQMAVMIATVANGGVRYKPLIVKSIEAANGQVIQRFSPTVSGRINVSQKTLSIVQTALWKAVNTRKGTAWKSRLEGIDISGKTGTAQVYSRKKGDTDEDEKNRPDRLKPHAWFVAYAPSKNPKIAVSVIVEHGEHGSTTAAPIARDVIKTYLEMNRGNGPLSANRRGEPEAIDKP